MTRRKINLLARPSVSVGIMLALVAVDQATKAFALWLLGDRVFDGVIRSDHARRVLGDFLWLFVAYNPGAAFSFAPQKFAPFLHPTLFYGVLVLLVGFFLGKLWMVRKDPVVRLAIAMVLGGALGNFVDRVRIHHVVDFISVGIPGITWRWPTFNIADLAICSGAVLLAWGERLVAVRRDHRAARHVPAHTPSEAGPDDLPSQGGA